jgi:hypothetical protein
MITCSKCGNVEYNAVHRSKIIRMIERLRNKQYHEDKRYPYSEKDLDQWAITYLGELIE